MQKKQEFGGGYVEVNQLDSCNGDIKNDEFSSIIIK